MLRLRVVPSAPLELYWFLYRVGVNELHHTDLLRDLLAHLLSGQVGHLNNKFRGFFILKIVSMKTSGLGFVKLFRTNHYNSFYKIIFLNALLLERNVFG